MTIPVAAAPKIPGQSSLKSEAMPLTLCLQASTTGQRNVSDLAKVRGQPGVTQVDAVAAHRDALSTQERELPPSSRDAPVGADDAMPGEVIVDGRENAPDQAGRAGIDV